MISGNETENKIVIICGATASGKSKFALNLAKKIRGCIINADALQIYKEIPIITAQPSIEEYQEIPHELYSIVECGDDFSVAMWLRMSIEKIHICKQQKQVPIIVGGSGMYIKSLVDGLAFVPEISSSIKEEIKILSSDYTPVQLHAMLRNFDAALADKLKIQDVQRVLRGIEVFLETNIPLSEWHKQTKSYYYREDFYIIYLNPPRSKIYQNCEERFIKMLRSGAIEEVMTLLKNKPNINYPKALGLKQLRQYIQEECSLESAILESQQMIRNYAKRQSTWFNNQIKYDLVLHSY